MPTVIPLEPGIGNTRRGVPIDANTYIFDQRWNSREQAWYLDVREIDETLVVAGVKLVLGVYLGRRVNHFLFREGVLVLIDTSGLGVDANYFDMGTRVLLMWFPMSEVLGQSILPEKLLL